MANVIPEWLTLALVLGVIGTITGVCSLILHFLKYRRERPNLLVNILDCRHKVDEDGKSTNLYIQYILRNKGDRGTKLNKIEAFATDFKGEKHYASKKLSKSLIAGDSLSLHHYFYFRPHFQYKKKMECIFKYIIHMKYFNSNMNQKNPKALFRQFMLVFLTSMLFFKIRFFGKISYENVSEFFSVFLSESFKPLQNLVLIIV